MVAWLGIEILNSCFFLPWVLFSHVLQASRIAYDQTDATLMSVDLCSYDSSLVLVVLKNKHILLFHLCYLFTATGDLILWWRDLILRDGGLLALFSLKANIYFSTNIFEWV